MAARPLADVDRPPAPGALLADVAAGASARPDRGGVAIRSLSRDRHAARPGMGGLAHPPDEHAAGRGAGHRAVVRHAPLVFRGRGQRRARAVCFYTIAHRAFLRRDNRWHRRTVHLSHRLPARALEKKSGAQANRADGAGAWWVAAAKLHTPPEMLLALALMLVLGCESILRRPRDWNWKPTLAALGIALLILWAGYLFHVSHVKVGNGQIVMTFPNRAARTLAIPSQTQLNLLVSAGEYAEGLRAVAISNRSGRLAWFFGKIYPNGGPKLCYPAAIALKWPTVLLLLFFASCCSEFARRTALPAIC